MAGAGTAGRKREERKQSRTRESDGPERKHEGPTVKDSSRGSKKGAAKKRGREEGKGEGRQNREWVLP